MNPMHSSNNYTNFLTTPTMNNKHIKTYSGKNNLTLKPDETPQIKYCHDKSSEGVYSEDMSAECVRSQTLLAHQIFNFNKIDPELPYCILRQESSKAKGVNDPFETSFDRLAVCTLNDNKKAKHKSELKSHRTTYCGIGLAQFTFGTWSGYESKMEENPDKQKMVLDCVNRLSQATNIPQTLTNVRLKNLTPSDLHDEIEKAKSKAPTSELSPLYRDHAICMNAYHLSELNKQDSNLKYSIKNINGKISKRSQFKQASQNRLISNSYNTGSRNGYNKKDKLGTPGYGNSIDSCVANFRDYDNARDIAANSYYIRPKGEYRETLASNGTASLIPNQKGIDNNL